MRNRVRVRVAKAVFLGVAALFWLAARGHAEPASSPVGLWKTVDDRTGAPRGLVRIYRQGDAYFGRVEASLVPDEAGARCIACEDDRKDQPVVGMVILRDVKAEEDGYGGGDILDPETGSVYRCSLHLEGAGQRLVVRGYIGLSLFGRSQTWLRADAAGVKGSG